MRVLIACEESGVVRRAFRAFGHDAWSCDLLPARDGSKHHFQRFAQDVISQGWDMAICHPPCTRLSNSGVLRLYVGGKKSGGIDHAKWSEMLSGAALFRLLWKSNVPRICIENPVVHGHAKRAIGNLPKPQSIQPYEFGHPESKRTCLWLKNLPPLRATHVLTRPACGHWENQTPSGQSKLGPSKQRARIRSTTYEGIANAMAEQWGSL